MKTMKKNLYLLSLCCAMSWMIELESAKDHTDIRSGRWARRSRPLASLLETDVAVQQSPEQPVVPSAPPVEVADTTTIAHDALKKLEAQIPRETKELETITEPEPIVAQAVNIDDGEDDDYDDLSDEEPAVEPDQLPVQEVIEEVVQKGPGFEVKKTEVIRPPDDIEQDVIEFQFEDADLQNLVKQMSDLYGLTFIPDDTISPMLPNGKAVKGNKISFRTQKPLSKKQAWHLFQTFLDVAGLSLVPVDTSTFRIVKTDVARKSAIPAFIGVKPDKLPDSEQLIRYLYFVENISIRMLEPIINELRSPASAFLSLQEMNAFVLTDKSYNIKSLMNIITELDRVAMPQAMSILKLKRANALEVKQLYETITKVDEKSATARLFPARKQPTALYFPENVRIIAEPRTNSLILLGAQDSIKKIEEFVATYVDVEIGKPYSPLRVFELKYADAITVAGIMNDLAQFGKDTPAGRFGGIRDGDKYLKPMSFTAEKETNRLIIRGDEDDYLKAKEILKALDEPQPQVAIEVLIINVNISDIRNLGTQIRSAQPGVNGLLGDNVKYQTSGSRIRTNINGSGIVTYDPTTLVPPQSDVPGVNRLLGNLITLATGAQPGNTLLTLGSDKFGIWGIFNVLQTVTDAKIISNPFLVATNKQPARVAIGELRRVVSGTIAGSTSAQNVNAFDNDAANLEVKITPQINSDGMIVLDLTINIDSFVNQADLNSATKNTKTITTTTIVADKEVLALGGLVKNQINNSISKVPILGNIPIIGWLFKNRVKTQTKDNLLVLISTRIIKPERTEHMTDFTRDRVRDYVVDREIINEPYMRRDPVDRFFFGEKQNSTEDVIDDFLFERSEEVLEESLKNDKLENLEKRSKKAKKLAKRMSKRNKRGKGVEPAGIIDPLVIADSPVVPGLMESIEKTQKLAHMEQQFLKKQRASKRSSLREYVNAQGVT